MKVKFLKGHLRHSAGEVAIINEESANYFIRYGVAVELKTVEPSKVTIAPTKVGKASKKK